MSHSPVPSRAEKEVAEALHRFYYLHHDQRKLQEELVSLVKETRVRTFNEVKKRLKGALDYRLSAIDTMGVLVGDSAYEKPIRSEEVRQLRVYVGGMVVKVDE